jgi:hypothetical protein
MYQPFTIKSGTAGESGAVGAVATNLTTSFKISGGDDGLVLDPGGMQLPITAAIPDRLFGWLVDLRLLRNIPLSYLVPDSDLLPPESIRFFHVDPTWVDRVIDGVFSAANTGTVDSTYSAAMLLALRTALDNALIDQAQQLVAGSGWNPTTDGMTGMLIRSDLIRRWPDLIVRASGANAATPILRAEPISKDVHITLFAGAPTVVEVREPHVGVRFGLEVNDKTNTLQVKIRDVGGKEVTINGTDVQPVALADQVDRVIQLHSVFAPGLAQEPRMMAIQLMRPPYVQRFDADPKMATEESGSVPAPPQVTLAGRLIDLADLLARQAAQQRLGRI